MGTPLWALAESACIPHWREQEFAANREGGPDMKFARALAVVIAFVACAQLATAQTVRVMVTNDDGIAAAGIVTLVERLVQNPNLIVTVVAPATNHSGAGDSRTTNPAATIGVTAGTSATALPVGVGNFPAYCDVATCFAVEGTPADSVYLGILQLMPERPDIVVSGINFGQNLGREIATMVSGTVGAALTAGRLGIPAVAVSHEIAGGIDYTPGAIYAANLVEDFRTKSRLAKRLMVKTGRDQRAIVYVNIPNCTSGGSRRGVEVVPVAEIVRINGYNLHSDTGSKQFYSPLVTNLGIGASNCNSSLVKPVDDMQAFSAGFVTVGVLNPDLTVDNKLKRFSFLRKIRFQ